MTVDNVWQAVSGAWSGSWDNPNHWTLGALGLGQRGRVNLTQAVPIEITFPAGEYNNQGEVFLRGEDTRWSTYLVGTNTTWIIAGSDNGTEIHSASPFAMTFGNYSFCYFNSTGPYSAPVCKLSNFKIGFVSTNDELLYEFDGGSYDFYEFDGIGAKSTFHVFTGDTVNFAPRRRLRFHDATFRVDSMNIGATEATGHSVDSLVEIDHSSISLSGTLFFPMSSDGNNDPTDPTVTEIKILNGSSVTFRDMQMDGNSKNGLLTNKTFIITVDGGSTFAREGVNKDFYNRNGHYVFNVLNNSSATFGDRSIYFGDGVRGVTDVNIVNASWKSQGSTTYFGPRTAANYTTMRANLNLTNATVEIAHYLRFTSAGLDLVDATLWGYDFMMDDAALATAKFHANGGVYRFTRRTTAFNGDLWHDWDEAKIGPRGFTIDNQCENVSVSQNFANDAGAEGVLTLTGTKAFTLSSENTTVSTVVLAGVAATFTETAKYASILVITNGASAANVPTNGLTGLVVGDTATTGALAIDFTRTIDIAGELVLANPVFTAANEPALNITNVLFRADAASAATRQAWRYALTDFMPDEGYGVAFETREADGRIEFLAILRAADTHEERLETATSETRSAPVSVASIDRVKATVAEGGVLTLAGELSEGRFEKHGEGTAVLSNPANRFIGGVALYEGVLGVTCPGALGYTGNNAVMELKGGMLDLDLADGSGPIQNPLALTASTPSNAIVVRATQDATVRAWTATAGAVLKTGPAALTLAATAQTALTASDGWHVADRGTRLLSQEPLVFNPNGTLASGAYAGLTVVEGRMVLKGPTNVTLRSSYAVAVGGSTSDSVTEDASLVVDGVTFDNFAPPRGLALATGMTFGGNTPAEMCSPSVVVTNGGTLKVGNLFVADDSDVQGNCCHPRPRLAAFGHSTLDIASYLYANSASATNFVTQVEARGKSRVLVGSLSADDPLYIANSAEFTFDDSVLARKADLTPLTVSFGSGWESIAIGFHFTNGAKFCCNKFYYASATYQHQGRIRLHFDDSAWLPGTTDYVFTPTNTRARVEVTGRGIVLSPPAGGTYRWLFETSGTGGLVKEGEGVLTLNATNATYAGVTTVTSGTLDLDGSTWTGRTFAGLGGTLANGSLVRCTVSNTNLTYDSSLQVGRSHVIDLGGEGTSGAVLIVGRYTGAAPDVSTWKITNAAESGISADFAADNGVITAKLIYRSLVIIVK